MQTDWLIIDGNNLIHREAAESRGPRTGDFVSARWRLARRLDELAGRLAARVTLVFDGTRGGRDEAFEASSIEVIFCPGHVTADTTIEQLVAGHARPERVLVVTSDRAERVTVEAAGAVTESCGLFLGRLDDLRREIDAGLRMGRRPSDKGATLGDFFPKV
jgi:predicted RNA-binding protein with PIN domain